jgi:hypothetical protein
VGDGRPRLSRPLMSWVPRRTRRSQLALAPGSISPVARVRTLGRWAHPKWGRHDGWRGSPRWVIRASVRVSRWLILTHPAVRCPALVKTLVTPASLTHTRAELRTSRPSMPRLVQQLVVMRPLPSGPRWLERRSVQHLVTRHERSARTVIDRRRLVLRHELAAPATAARAAPTPLRRLPVPPVAFAATAPPTAPTTVIPAAAVLPLSAPSPSSGGAAATPARGDLALDDIAERVVRLIERRARAQRERMGIV